MNYAWITALIALGTIGVGAYKKIVEVIRSLMLFLFGRLSMDKNVAASIYAYCNKHMKPTGFRGKTIFGTRMLNHRDFEINFVAVDMLSYERIVYRKGWRFLSIGPGGWFYNATENKFERGVTLHLPRIMWKQDEFIQKCITEFELKSANRFSVKKFYGKNKNPVMLDGKEPKMDLPTTNRDIVAAIENGCARVFNNCDGVFSSSEANPFDYFPYHSSIMKYVDEAQFWMKSQAWYKRKNIPWKMGWIVYGKPGSGKTLLIANVAKYLNMPIFSFDLNSMTNEEFSNFWDQASSSSPCVVLFEDFDNVFDKRERVIETSSITFDCVINCISGAASSDGIFLAVTTNHIDKLDCALGCVDEGMNEIPSRPGRIDRMIEINDMDDDCRYRFASRMLENASSEKMDEVVKAGENMTAAQFSEYCKRICIDQYYKTKFLEGLPIEPVAQKPKAIPGAIKIIEHFAADAA